MIVKTGLLDITWYLLMVVVDVILDHTVDFSSCSYCTAKLKLIYHYFLPFGLDLLRQEFYC